MVHVMSQEVGDDMDSRRSIWIRGRPDYEPLFSFLGSLRLDGEKLYWIEHKEAERMFVTQR